MALPIASTDKTAKNINVKLTDSKILNQQISIL
jgi:hypothetical protein